MLSARSLGDAGIRSVLSGAITLSTPSKFDKPRRQTDVERSEEPAPVNGWQEPGIRLLAMPDFHALTSVLTFPNTNVVVTGRTQSNGAGI